MKRLEDATPSEELAGWLETMPEDERIELERAWSLSEMGRGPEPSADDVTSAWTELSGRLGATSRLRLVGGRTTRWAAAAVVVFLIGTVWMQYRTITLVGHPGHANAFQLPDGSSVELAAASRLEYRAGFRGEMRLARLHGEAFFDVTPEGKTFRVETFNSQVDVLGTRFNVRSWESDPEPETVVTLEEGSVRLTAVENPARSIVLQPGERAAIPGDGETRPAALNRVTAWRDGGFYFEDWSLPTILAEIERRYDMRIAYPSSMSGVRLTLYHDRPARAEVLLEAIGAAMGSSFQTTPQGFRIVE